MDHPKPGLRYIDAGDLDDSAFKFDGLDVESHTAEKLGKVEGFIIDITTLRPRYVVVDASGWFTSKHFLLPVGQVALDTAQRKLIAQVSKEQVKRFPGFDLGTFEKLNADELERMDRQFAIACWSEESVNTPDFDARYAEWKRAQDATWWDSSYYSPTRFDTAARTVAASAASQPSRDEELVTARERSTTVGDVSPHFAGRAQPGDVLGVETGGERTYVGDTTDDENKRREDAEKTASKARD